MTPTDLATQLYQIEIKASPEAIWNAITTPDQTSQFFHGARIEVTPDRYLSHGPDGSVWGNGAVMEWDPPHRLVHEWRSLYDPELADEPASRVTWVVEAIDGKRSRLTLTHDQLEGAPRTAQSVSGPGWTGVLTALQTLLDPALEPSG